MADVLAHIFKKFLYSNDARLYSWVGFVGELSCKRTSREYFDRLKNQVKKMMVGYENEQVHSLLDEMELVTLEKPCDIIYGSPKVGVGEVFLDTLLEIMEKLCDIRYGSDVEGKEIVVGFDDEVETLLDQLTQTSIKQFQVISIAGMAGLGKTTLARNLYNNPLIEYHFDIRAWACVSQIYVKRDLLLSILSSFIYDLTQEIYNMNDEQLGEKLYRFLKDRRYLVVLDDMWDCMAWNDLQIYFPDDKVGSRVLFTSRDIDVSLHVGAARPAHVLRLRTTDESWQIFQKKIFRTGICSFRLTRIGRRIAKQCEGLPLAIVIAVGLVKTQLSESWWIEIARSLRSFMVRDPSQYMDTLALSYNHLPPHLRSCFLFVGVFPEDYDIPVTKLIWLWIAQGFIHQTGSRTLEDVAEDLLMDLIKRSLLMTAKKRDDGKVKTCRIHDLLRDLCLRKGEEHDFSPEIYRTPNLRKLGFCGPLISSQGDLEFPSTGSLQKLQKLKLLNTVAYPVLTRSCNPILFPEVLKKLTLSNIGMNWEEMWSFSLLPNLEVLKLKFHACIGERWDTGDAEFGRLKIMKLQGLDLREWVCSRDNFPRLQRLVVHHCLKLNSIPLEVGRILTLEVIEVRGCSMSAKASALNIQQEQESEGNSSLKVHAINNVSGLA